MLEKFKNFCKKQKYFFGLYFFLFKDNLSNRLPLILLFFLLELINYLLFFKDISSGEIWTFWTITGTILSILTTIILIEPSNGILREIENLQYTKQILRQFHSIFYIYLQCSRFLTNAEENKYRGDYYSNPKFKKNKIDDLQQELKKIELHDNIDNQEKLLKSCNVEYLNDILECLKEIEKIFSNIPYELKINSIRYEITDFVNSIKYFLNPNSFVKGQFARLGKDYVKILEKLQKNTFLNSIFFQPDRCSYNTIICVIDKNSQRGLKVKMKKQEDSNSQTNK